MFLSRWVINNFWEYPWWPTLIDFLSLFSNYYLYSAEGQKFPWESYMMLLNQCVSLELDWWNPTWMKLWSLWNGAVTLSLLSHWSWKFLYEMSASLEGNLSPFLLKSQTHGWAALLSVTYDFFYSALTQYIWFELRVAWNCSFSGGSGAFKPVMYVHYHL